MWPSPQGGMPGQEKAPAPVEAPLVLLLVRQFAQCGFFGGNQPHGRMEQQLGDVIARRSGSRQCLQDCQNVGV